MLVLRLETDHPAERFEELIRGIDNEFKVELSDDICFFFGDLGGRILVGAAGHQLLDLRNLVSFLKLSSNVESSHSHQLQFTQRHFFHGQVLVNDGSDREQRLREHLVFVMQFTEPVDQLGPRLFRDCLMTGDVVMQSVGLLLSTLHELQVLRKVFWDHLRVVNIELDLNGLNLNMGPIIAGGDIALLGIQGKVSESICMKKGIIPLGFLVVKRIKISDVVTKGSRVHVSVRLIYYNCHGDNFIMRYN